MVRSVDAECVAQQVYMVALALHEFQCMHGRACKPQIRKTASRVRSIFSVLFLEHTAHCSRFGVCAVQMYSAQMRSSDLFNTNGLPMHAQLLRLFVTDTTQMIECNVNLQMLGGMLRSTLSVTSDKGSRILWSRPHICRTIYWHTGQATFC